MQDNEDKYDITIEYSNKLTVEDILLDMMINSYENMSSSAY